MFCLSCGYALDDIPGPHCPECGRVFDPKDPGTFRSVPLGKLTAGQTRQLAILEWFLTALYGGFVAPVINYSIAWLVLGHPPQPGIDDPKHIPHIGWLSGVCMLAMILAIPSLMVGTVLPIYIGEASYPRRRSDWWIWRVILPALVFGGSLLVLIATARDIGEWWMD